MSQSGSDSPKAKSENDLLSEDETMKKAFWSFSESFVRNREQ